MIKVIAFDLGNTVLTDDWNFKNKKKIEDFKRAFGIKNLNINPEWIDICIKINTGKISEDEYWRRFLKIYGAEKKDVELAKNLYKKHTKENEHMLSLLRKLKRRKVRMISITSIGKEWLKYKINKYRLKEFFDFIVSSCHTGLTKYDQRIYKLAIKKLKIKPGECLFIDNSWNKVIPAKLAGMKVIHFKDQRNLEKKLSKMGIL